MTVPEEPIARPADEHGEATHGFGLQNLPYGVDEAGHVVTAYGGHAVDLAALARTAGGSGAAAALPGPEVFSSGSLNAFMALGPPTWAATRRWLRRYLAGAPRPATPAGTTSPTAGPGPTAGTTSPTAGPGPTGPAHLPPEAVRPLEDVRLVLPFEVADYVDFYSCEAHVRAMGQLLRPGEDPLPPAWRHLPIGYHGRSATVVVSGEQVPRPRAIVAGPPGPQYGPARRLDVEAELGFVIGEGNRRGEPVPASRAREHVFGVVVVNDWSARDVQAFEYRPLGPFLGKSFATSISPWVVPLEALEPWRVPGPAQEPCPAPYLEAPEPRGFAITLELALNGTAISTVAAAGLYWSMAQQFAHLTVNGAATRTGELFATGTISGPGPGEAGSLMELTSGGSQPLVLGDGSQRTWLEDGDEVVVRAWCGERGLPGWISLGEVRAVVVPAGAAVAGPSTGRAPVTERRGGRAYPASVPTGGTEPAGTMRAEPAGTMKAARKKVVGQ
ncbi:MAG: fumarylacetoacetate hydrolase family protein [Acidimicrobiales bacterium]